MDELEFRPTNYTLQDVADEYGKSVSTVRKWLSPIHADLLKLSKVNKKRMRTINSKQLKKIHQFLGTP